MSADSSIEGFTYTRVDKLRESVHEAIRTLAEEQDRKAPPTIPETTERIAPDLDLSQGNVEKRINDRLPPWHEILERVGVRTLADCVVEYLDARHPCKTTLKGGEIYREYDANPREVGKTLARMSEREGGPVGDRLADQSHVRYELHEGVCGSDWDD